jgi:Domain of unknown function (DUF4386)
MSSTKNPGRFAGLLYILLMSIPFFAMVHVPSKLIVHGNAAATANNIAASETLFRFGIVAQLIGQAGFIFVALALYDLLKGGQPAVRLAHGDIGCCRDPDSVSE